MRKVRLSSASFLSTRTFAKSPTVEEELKRIVKHYTYRFIRLYLLKRALSPGKNQSEDLVRVYAVAIVVLSNMSIRVGGLAIAFVAVGTLKPWFPTALVSVVR